jgi:hypothetical protein
VTSGSEMLKLSVWITSVSPEPKNDMHTTSPFEDSADLFFAHKGSLYLSFLNKVEQ